MQVWQRGVAATTVVDGAYHCDRYSSNNGTGGAYTTERSTDTPTGTGFSLKAQVTTADTSLTGTQYAFIEHNIEAQNLQSLRYGTSNAKNITLSFSVKSSKTGTYTVLLRKLSGTDCHLVHEYTIDSANTWERKEITISPTAGSTSIITASTGAIAADNENGLQVGWGFAYGPDYKTATNNTWSTNTNHYSTSNQVNWLDSTSNNFYLTEVQLEVGEQATAFEHRSFGDELRRCKRYFTRMSDTDGLGNDGLAFAGLMANTVAARFAGRVLMPMRTDPTLSVTNDTQFFVRVGGGSFAPSSGMSFQSHDNGAFIIACSSSSSQTSGSGVTIESEGAHIDADAEL
tara:strand:- start:2888 stop:3919 length:1032 start_codon:yes stop_codon:yes gene_type:complete